jgi:hypothetical protein
MTLKMINFQLKQLGEFAFFLVKSDIDAGIYGPFLTYEEALVFAEDADGSIFHYCARPISGDEEGAAI